MSAGSSKGGGLPKHRSLPNDNLSTDLGELHQRRMDPGAGSMAGRCGCETAHMRVTNP
jgi:hypothetical protein